MADKEYIEREGFIDRLKFKRDNGINRGNKYPGLESAIAQAQKYPATDVAPRSEVAREIFEEIGNILSVGSDGVATLDVSELYAIERKYTEERPIALDDKVADAAERSAETGSAEVRKDEYVKE